MNILGGNVYEYFSAALFGGLVGFVELTARYRGTTFKDLLFLGPVWFYIFLNMGSAILALYFFISFDFLYDNETITEPEKVIRVLTAAFSSIAFLRSSFFIAKIGDTDVQAGPGQVIQHLLNYADKQISWERGTDRSKAAVKIMKNVDFNKAYNSLPIYCFQMMQNVDPEEETQVAEAIIDLKANTKMDNRTKAITLGLILLTVTGSGALEEAVKALGDAILVKEADRI